ncbi:hypothetical protein [Nonomuraea sp. NPDC049480]|uniref:hypothetical protein n=1 Tax=Nonomuraea sp. NPDC049480 TaxID=3364353 RepID=UPI0037A00DE5
MTARSTSGEACARLSSNHSPSAGKPSSSAAAHPVSVRLFVSNRDGGPVLLPAFTQVWQRALTRAGIVPVLEEGEARGARFREHGMHMLRKYFTSVLLAGAESPKAVAEWLAAHGDGG